MSNIQYDPADVMPIIRRVMPSIIARDIVGNSGFYAPYIPLLTIGIRIPFSKANYRHFLRLNDRKTSHTVNDVRQAGYLSQAHARPPYTPEEAAWVDETFGDRVVNFYDQIYFAYEQDLTLYLLRWS